MNSAEVLIKFKGDTTDVDKSTKEVSTGLGKLTKAFTIGGLATKGISKAIGIFNEGLDSSINRIDTMNNFTTVMENLGIASEDSAEVISSLSEELVGLPTTLNSAASSVQRLTSYNGDIKKSEKYFLAMNNAIIAGTNDAGMQASALEQLTQAYTKGKPDMQDWKTLLQAMPAQLKQVAKALGYPQTDQLYEALKNGEVSMNDFMDTLVQLNETGVEGFATLEEQARANTAGIGTSITNMKTAFVRGIGGIITSIDESLESFGGLSGVITKLGKFGEEAFKGLGDVLKDVIPMLIEIGKKVMPSLQKAFKTIAPVLKKLASSLLPAIGKLLDKIAPAIAKILEKVMPLISKILDSLIPLLDPLIDFLAAFIDYNIALMEPLLEILNVILPPIVDILSKLLQTILPLITGALKLATDALKNMFGWIGDVLSGIMGFFNKVIDFVKNNWQGLLLLLVNPFAGAFKLLYDNFGGFRDFINNIMSGIKGIIDNVANFFQTAFQKAADGVKAIFEGVKNTAKNIIDAVVNIIKIPINVLIDGLNLFIKALNKIKIPNWVPGVGGKGLHFDKIKKLATGTNYVPDDMLAIIHEGEAVVPKKFNPYANNFKPSNMSTMQSSNIKPIVNVYADFKTDPLGQTVSNIKTFSGGAKNDYNYGVGV